MRDIAQTTHGELLANAAAGDQAAWNALVDQFGQMVWSIARSFRLDEATAKDVSQTVWMRLVENLDKIHDPERLPGWLATTCRREALRVVKLADRSVPTDFEYDLEDQGPPLEAMLIEDEEIREVVAAFHTLNDECRQLLRLLTVEPALSYEEISEVIDRPVGSLGPTRARCIERLKSAMRGIRKQPDDSSGRGGERDE
ncbi:MAG TPA: sigma-70 family RNA polymerase sigma factor [Acidimicrobiia bacterium]|nr:sigma-70 family RNA polymerase sigma factor [Acidimicrobiia bacterium]